MMVKSVFIAVVLLAVVAAGPARSRRSFSDWIDPPDTAQLILNNGYPVEKHVIETEDGYILGVFRIPYGKNQEPQSARPPVLIQHGILSSSDSWVISIPEKGLAYFLADNGYDVWLGNNRGISYSRKNINYTTDDAEFWNYSFHDMGVYDIPAVIDYILNKTEAKTVSYVGHSQGTSQFFAMASVRPEYNSKIRVASLLAPVAFLDGTQGLVRVLEHFSKALAFAANIFGVHHVLDHSFIVSAADHFVCRPNSWLRFLCEDIIEIVAGFDTPQINQTLIEIATEYSPTGASIKQLLHFAQLTSNGNKFTMFDYGKDNVKYYGQDTPKEYNLSAITAPVMLHFAENDYISRKVDVQKIANLLPKNKMIRVPDAYFNHLDFMWAKDVVPLLYRDVLHYLKMFL